MAMQHTANDMGFCSKTFIVAVGGVRFLRSPFALLARSRLQGSVKFTIYIYTRSHYRFSTATRSVVATKYNSSYIMLSLKCSLCTNVSPAPNLPLRMVKHSRGGLLANSQRLRATTGLLRQNTLRS